MASVRVTQIATHLSNFDDRECLPAGPRGSGSAVTYRNMTLDQFHNEVPIGCLDDFDIEEIE